MHLLWLSYTVKTTNLKIQDKIASVGYDTQDMKATSSLVVLFQFAVVAPAPMAAPSMFSLQELQLPQTFIVSVCDWAKDITDITANANESMKYFVFIINVFCW